MFKKIKNKIRYYRWEISLFFKKIYSWVKENLFIVLPSVALISIFVFPTKFGAEIRIIDKDNIIILLTVIVGSLSSILGIVVAIQLVAFEILRKTFFSFAFKDFFASNNSKYLFIRYIFTISIGTLNIIILKDNPDTQDYLFTYLTIILFFYCLLILFPSTKKLILQSKSKDKITQLVSKITQQTIRELDYFRPKMPIKHQMEIIEDNPLFILSDVCIRSINEEDRITPRFLISESTSRLLELLKESDRGQGARDIINSFFIIYRNAFEKSSVLRQNGILLTLLNVIEEIYHHCAINKFKWYSMIELNEEIEKMAITLIDSNNNELGRRTVWLLERIYLEQIKNNVPEEKDIWLLNWEDEKVEKTDKDDSNQWSEISSSLLYILNKIIKHSIELQKEELIWTGLQRFTSIANEACSSKLGDKQKLLIIQDCFYYARSLTIESSELHLIKKSTLMIPFEPFSMDRILEPSKEYSKRALLYFGSTFIELAKREQLPLNSLNNIGATGRFCMNKIDHSDFIKDATLYLTNVLVKIFEIVEHSNIPDKNQFLLETYNQTESIRKWFKGDSDKYVQLLNELDDKLNRINKVKHLASEQTKNTNWTEIL